MNINRSDFSITLDFFVLDTKHISDYPFYPRFINKFYLQFDELILFGYKWSIHIIIRPEFCD